MYSLALGWCLPKIVLPPWVSAIDTAGCLRCVRTSFIRLGNAFLENVFELIVANNIYLTWPWVFLGKDSRAFVMTIPWESNISKRNKIEFVDTRSARVDLWNYPTLAPNVCTLPITLTSNSSISLGTSCPTSQLWTNFGMSPRSEQAKPYISVLGRLRLQVEYARSRLKEQYRSYPSLQLHKRDDDWLSDLGNLSVRKQHEKPGYSFPAYHESHGAENLLDSFRNHVYHICEVISTYVERRFACRSNSTNDRRDWLWVTWVCIRLWRRSGTCQHN